MSLITVIGRGHGGTRAMSHTLTASGVYMGSMLNTSGDLLPPGAMYDACRVFAKYVTWKGDLEWDFSQVLAMEPTEEFQDLVRQFLKSVLENKSENKGWKLPETTLVFPWIVKMFPEANYIFWVRNPRDSILDRHVTDDMRDFGIDYPVTEDMRLRRAISWYYQYKLVKATPKPQKWIEVRFEDFVMKQPSVLRRLERFLGFKMGRIIVRPDAVDRWKKAEGVSYFDFFEPAMKEYKYEMPTESNITA